MATKPKTKIGHMPCLCCGEKIPVKAAENGTLNISCPECDFTGYLRAGTDAHRKVSSRITRVAEPPEPAKPAAKAPAAQVPTAAPAPTAPTVRKTVFG